MNGSLGSSELLFFLQSPLQTGGEDGGPGKP